MAARLEDEPPEHAEPVEYRERRYTNGHAVHLDGLPDYPTEEQIEALLENHANLHAIWDQTTHYPPEDTSPSGWDQSFASTLAALGFPPERVASYLRAYRAHHSPEKGKQDRADYIVRTVERAQPADAYIGEDQEPGGEQDDCPPEDEPPYEAGQSAGAGGSNGAGQQQTAGDAQGQNRGTFKRGPQGKPADDWPEPGVLGDPPAAPKFPIELLPQQLKWWVATQAETMGIPYDVLALPALVCIAGVIGKDAVLKAKRHDLSWTERPCIWGALIMPKGSLKSPAIKAAMTPIRAAQAQARERWHEEVRVWEARQERTSKGAIKPKPDDPKPKEPKILLGDATIEAIADAMANSRGLTMVRDELSGLVALVAQVAHAARPQALLVPAAADPAGLADPRLVQEPDFHPLGLGMVVGDLGDQRRELFFKSLLSLALGLGVHGPRLLPGQVEIVQQPQHAVLAVDDPEALLDQPTEVLGPPRAEAIPLGRGAPGRPPEVAPGSQPRSTDALNAASWPSSSRGRRPLLGRSRRPSTPSALKRITRSRSVWRSMPARRAACPRLMPSNALATPSRRHATRRSLSCRARRRSSSAGMSPRSANRAPMAHPAASPRSAQNRKPPNFTTRVSQNIAGLVLLISQHDI